MRFTYTAKRRLASGHSVETEYDYVIDGAAIDQDESIESETTTSLNGSMETDFQRIDVFWDVSTDFIETATRLAEFREFLASVAGGEVFTFDPEATDGTAVDEYQVKLVSQRHRRRRIGMLDAYTYSVRMRVQPAA